MPDGVHSRFDSAAFLTAQKIPQWEAHTGRHILEIQCSSVNRIPLSAVQKNGSAGSLRLAEMQVSPHVIERGPADVLKDRRDLVMVVMLVEGEGLLGQGGRWVHARDGDIVVLCTDQPFLLTYTRAVRQIVLTMTQSEFAQLYGRRINELEHISRSDFGMARSSNLSYRCVEWLSHDNDLLPGEIREFGIGILSDIFIRDPAQGKKRLSAHFLAAQARIADYISDADLSPSKIADELGISLRHLNRLFKKENTTVARSIRVRRLQLARNMLRDPTRAALNLGEIAYMCGFSDQSLFSRQFRQEFGMSPGAARVLAEYAAEKS